MRAVVRDWQPRNRITTPLAGTPSYVNSGIIKAVMKNGEKISVAQIDYQEFDEENFQYVISPYWEIVDGLPASVFQGIPGIDMDLRLETYYRVNYIPTFIAERTPSENREDVWELLDADEIFTVITNGVDIISESGQMLVDITTRSSMIPIIIAQKIIAQREYAKNRRSGIEQAKKQGKYTGRKPIEVDEKVLRQVNQELKAGLISVEEAMKRTKIGSKSTFYRKVRALD